jgi:hypothetical protein
MDGQEESRAGEGLLPELEGGPDMRVPQVSARARRPMHRFGGGGLAGPGPLLGLGQLVSPRPLFPFSFFCFHFLFFFYFFHTICKKMPQINSNHFQKFLKSLALFLKQ